MVPRARLQSVQSEAMSRLELKGAGVEMSGDNGESASNMLRWEDQDPITAAAH